MKEDDRFRITSNINTIIYAFFSLILRELEMQVTLNDIVHINMHKYISLSYSLILFAIENCLQFSNIFLNFSFHDNFMPINICIKI